MYSFRKSIVAGIVFLMFGVAARLVAQHDSASVPTALDSIVWVADSGRADLEDIAEIQLRPGFVFTGKKGTQVMMEEFHNLVSGDEVGMVVAKKANWFVVYEYEASGYVKDDEKADLDADAMMKSIRENNVAANKERRSRGWDTLGIAGWFKPPKYNEKTNNLEWAISLLGHTGDTTVNFNTRRLGRQGVMRITLVDQPDSIARALPAFDSLMSTFTFKPGKTYAEFREGDKVAEYGLTALVVGGATAVAAKTGLLKYLWKILVVGGAAIAGYAKKLFSRKKDSPPGISA